jgi:hypothetical protein
VAKCKRHIIEMTVTQDQKYRLQTGFTQSAAVGRWQTDGLSTLTGDTCNRPFLQLRSHTCITI